MSDLSGKTALVVGASRGIGRGIALALDGAGASVVAVARDPEALAGLTGAHPGIRGEVTDAAREGVASELISRHQPDTLVLVAGAIPVSLPLHEHTWETFSVHWHADVKIAFGWLKAALLAPLPPGSRVVVISSGAAVFGSPASGGYAGAKATQRIIAGYAAEESRRAGLGISVTAVLPAMTPAGDVGKEGIRAYAARSGKTEEEFITGMGQPLTSRIPRLYLGRICRRIGTAHDRMNRAGITRGGQHRFSTGSGNDGKQPASTGQSRHENGPPDSPARRPDRAKHDPRIPRSAPQYHPLSSCRAITMRWI